MAAYFAKALIGLQEEVRLDLKNMIISCQLGSTSVVDDGKGLLDNVQKTIDRMPPSQPPELRRWLRAHVRDETLTNAATGFEVACYVVVARCEPRSAAQRRCRANFVGFAA